MSKRPAPKPPNIVLVSDLHCGSQFALCPREFDPNPDGSAVREFIRQSWASFCADAISRGPFILVVNGDIIEGLHHGGKEIISPDPIRHWRMALAAIRPLADKAMKTYLVEGTECHTQGSEFDFAKELKAEPGQDGDAHFRLRLRVNGLEHVFVHHIGTSSRPWTEITALQSALISEQDQAARAGEPRTDILVCSHRHTGAMFKSDAGICATSASWQFPTRHVRKVVPHARPVVGGLIIKHEAPGEWPHIVHHHYRPEPMRGFEHG